MGLLLIDAEGKTPDPGWDEIAERAKSTTTFWLDLVEPTDDDVEKLASVLGFHHLAVDDSRAFHQRAKLVPFDDSAFVVAFGVRDDSELVEVHCHYRLNLVVTVRHERCKAIEAWQDDKSLGHEFAGNGLLLLYRLLDALANSFPAELDDIDERLTAIEDAVLDNPTSAHVSDISGIKRQIAHMRRAIIPGRDLLGGGTSLAIEELPGMNDDSRRYFRDLYDHLVHVADQADTEREHAASVMDVYLTTVNNRQNDVMKQLAAVSTIFLPLMFITGFFGMNFPDLVRSINGWPAFLVMGVGLQVVITAGTVAILKRRGWW